MNSKLQSSELVLNKNGRIYHLDLGPEDISRKIILVGDPKRVELVSSFFEQITVKRQNREFVTHTGLYKGEPVSVIATGIGTDNIDIVMNELDALKNIDLQTRKFKESPEHLLLVRLGTSGALQEDIQVNDVVAGAIAMGLDNVPLFYANRAAATVSAAEMLFYEQTAWPKDAGPVYFVEADPKALETIGAGFKKGITISAPGFYGPQGRALRMPLKDPSLNDKLAAFSYNNLPVTNFEMESSALYAFARLMGHKALTLCKIIANRITKSYNPDYQQEMKNLVQLTLDRLKYFKIK